MNMIRNNEHNDSDPYSIPYTSTVSTAASINDNRLSRRSLVAMHTREDPHSIPFHGNSLSEISRSHSRLQSQSQSQLPQHSFAFPYRTERLTSECEDVNTTPEQQPYSIIPFPSHRGEAEDDEEMHPHDEKKHELLQESSRLRDPRRIEFDDVQPRKCDKKGEVEVSDKPKPRQRKVQAFQYQDPSENSTAVPAARRSSSYQTGNGGSSRGRRVHQWRTDVLIQRGGGSTEMARVCYKQIMQQRKALFSSPGIVIPDVDNEEIESGNRGKKSEGETEQTETQKQTHGRRPRRQASLREDLPHDEQDEEDTQERLHSSWYAASSDYSACSGSEAPEQLPSWRNLFESREHVVPFDETMRDKLKRRLSIDLGRRVSQVYQGDYEVVEGIGKRHSVIDDDDGRFIMLQRRISRQANFTEEQVKMDNVIQELSQQLIGYYDRNRHHIIHSYDTEDCEDIHADFEGVDDDDDDIKSIMSVLDISLAADAASDNIFKQTTPKTASVSSKSTAISDFNDDHKHDFKGYEQDNICDVTDINTESACKSEAPHLSKGDTNRKLYQEKESRYILEGFNNNLSEDEEDVSLYEEVTVIDDESFDEFTVLEENAGAENKKSHTTKQMKQVEMITSSHVTQLAQSRMFSDLAVCSPQETLQKHAEDNMSMYEEYTVLDEEEEDEDGNATAIEPVEQESAGTATQNEDAEDHFTITLKDDPTLPTESFDTDDDDDDDLWGTDYPSDTSPQSNHTTPTFPNSLLGSGRVSEIFRRDIWSGDKDVILTALQELCKEAELGSQQRSHIVRFGGLLSIVHGMGMNTNHTEIQTTGCRALEQLALDKMNQMTIVEAGGVQAIVKAMKQHLENIGIQQAGCKALYCVTHEASINVDASDISNAVGVVDAFEGVVETICICMKTYSNDDTIQEKGFGVLAHLCVDHSQRLQELKRAGGLATMTISLQRPWESHSDKHEAISTLSILLRLLAECDDNQLQ